MKDLDAPTSVELLIERLSRVSPEDQRRWIARGWAIDSFGNFTLPKESIKRPQQKRAGAE